MSELILDLVTIGFEGLFETMGTFEEVTSKGSMNNSTNILPGKDSTTKDAKGKLNGDKFGEKAQLGEKRG